MRTIRLRSDRSHRQKMTADRFDYLARQHRCEARPPSKAIAYARPVLVDGFKQVEIAAEAGVTQQAVSQAVRYFLTLDRLVTAAEAAAK